MKTEFIRKDHGNRRLLLIFAGWGSAASFYDDLTGIIPSGWDVAAAYDYNDFIFPADSLAGYDTVYLLAWSLGVAAAEASLPHNMITAAFAVNGTGCPVHDSLGIPPAIFKGTAESLDLRNLEKFRRRMTGSRDMYDRIASRLYPDADIENLRDQLYRFLDISSIGPRLPWKRAYCADNDRIFPISSQLAFWKMTDNVEICRVEGDHYIELSSVISQIIPDLDTIGRRFHDALASYDTHASAQHAIAARLAQMLSLSKGGRVLEIGPGSGLLTRLYADRICPDEAWFVDLYPLPEFGIAATEHYVTGDAEQWIASSAIGFDYILSSSAIQWFANPETFLANAASRLNPGGIIALSSFLPGNLSELDYMRPAPLLYPSDTKLREWMENYFSDVRIETGEIRLRFHSPREALLHLKLTGVGGNRCRRMSSSDLRRLADGPDGHCTLTFRPVYLSGKKPSPAIAID